MKKRKKNQFRMHSLLRLKSVVVIVVYGGSFCVIRIPRIHGVRKSAPRTKIERTMELHFEMHTKWFSMFSLLRSGEMHRLCFFFTKCEHVNGPLLLLLSLSYICMYTIHLLNIKQINLSVDTMSIIVYDLLLCLV